MFKQHLALKKMLFLSWALFVTAGFFSLFHYANVDGPQGPLSKRWPASTPLLPAPSTRPTLLLFAHPRCPCSQASIGELERMLPALHGDWDIITVFVKPKNQTDDWAQEGLWQKAHSLPNVKVVLDSGGVIADQFGALTSGQVYLYDKNSALVFSGGITPERGHMGENDGQRALLNYHKTGMTSVPGSPVFGCSLKNPERANVWKVGHENHHHH